MAPITLLIHITGVLRLDEDTGMVMLRREQGKEQPFILTQGGRPYAFDKLKREWVPIEGALLTEEDPSVATLPEG